MLSGESGGIGMDRGLARQELYTIVEKRKLKTVYQPIFRLDTTEAYAFESLTRGPSESRYAHPLTLFQDAIEFDMAHDLDLLAVQTALKGAENQVETKLFINILPSTLVREEVLQRLLELVESSALAKQQLVFELTERTQVDDFNELRQIINILRERGVSVAIDDLGQGYSSLAAVIELEPEYVKLDRTLVSGIATSSLKQKITDVLIDISKEGMKLIAEGIEKREDLDYLKEAGVMYGQGYLLGKPGPLSIHL